MPEENSAELDLDVEEEQSVLSHLRALFNTLLHLFYLSAPDLDDNTHTQSLRLTQTVYVSLQLVKTLQLISLLYPVQPFIPEWDNFSPWTTAVGIIRVDYLLVRLNMGQVMLYAGIGMVVFPVLTYVVLYRSLRAHKEKKWRLRVFLFKAILKLTSGVLYMPLLAIFLAGMRYPGS